jgi:hypothetical protein
MNKRLIIAAAAAFCCALAFGEGPSVVLQNHENVPFSYVVDPKELEGLTAGSPLMTSTVAGYFAAPAAEGTFSSIPAQGEARLAGLSVGTHLLVGFFTEPGTDDFPVRVITLRADSTVGERFYGIFASPAQLTVRRGVGRLSQIAQVPLDSGTTTESAPSSLPVVASFGDAYAPAFFTRETRDGFTVLPIEESRSWMQTGTRIASIQEGGNATGVKLVLNVPGGFSSSVSYFLYVFDTRTAGKENPLTLEIEPLARTDRGVCILWRKDAAAPRLLGTVKTGATSVELDMGADELASGVLGPAGADSTVDLTAGWYDKALGMWEEFYYTTFPGPAADSTR